MKAKQDTASKDLNEALTRAAKSISEAAGSMSKELDTVGRYVTEAMTRATAEQLRISEKISNGSRLTKHRFTSRLGREGVADAAREYKLATERIERGPRRTSGKIV